MRLFLGLFPGEDELAQIRDIVRSLDKIKRNFKFMPYEQMHLTIKFLGSNISSGTTEALIEDLNKMDLKISNPILKVNKVMYGFPGQKSPNVMFLDIEREIGLDKLMIEVNNYVKQLGYDDVIKRKDWKKLTHHITIARTKRSVSGSLVRSTREAISRIKHEKIEFTTDRIYLVQSTLSPTGPVYKKLAHFKINK